MREWKPIQKGFLLYVVGPGKKATERGHRKDREARANMRCLENGVYVMSCTGAGVLGAWRREVPEGAKHSGGNRRGSAPMITRLDCIAKAVEGHYRV